MHGIINDVIDDITNIPCDCDDITPSHMIKTLNKMADKSKCAKNCKMKMLITDKIKELKVGKLLNYKEYT